MKKFTSPMNPGTSSCAILLLAFTVASCSENARTAASAPTTEDEGTVPVMGTPPAAGTATSSSAGGAMAARASAVETPPAADAGDRDPVAPAGDSSTASAGSARQPARDGGGSVTLTAIARATPGGARGIAAEWLNGTDRVIFLRGCGTADGWYLEDGEWHEHGQFALCAAETQTIEVSPGESYVDLAGAGAPPQRGSNVWRLVARYGTGCRSGELFAASECREIHELVSVNQLRWQ